MVISFYKLWEDLDNASSDQPPVGNPAGGLGANPDDQNTPLLTSGDESQSMRVIQTGLEMKKEGDATFWDDFKSITSDAEGVAELLDVSRDDVSSWASKIDELIEKVQASQGLEGTPDEDSKKKEMMPTGEAPRADLGGNDAYKNGPADTRPMP